MVASQNGWRANDRSVITSFAVPGGSLPLRVGPAGQCLALVALRYHQTVEKLLWPGCWGFAERLVRGSAYVISNHASGTAIDLCAPLHPLGTDPRSNFSSAELSAIRTLVNACRLHGKQLIRWGGDYVGRKDGMHWEVCDGVTEAELAELLPILQALVTNHPAPVQNGVVWGHIVNAAPGTRTIGLGSRGPNDVEYVQRWHGLVDDGDFGVGTATAVKETQKRNGLTADGIVGPATWRAILGH